jgi:hypothetical protein
MSVGAAHYNRTRPRYHHQNSLTDGVVHVIENNHPADRRASSVQSLQTMFASTTPSTSISYPRLQQVFLKQNSSPTPPLASCTTIALSKRRNAPAYTSLHRIDKLCSIPKTRTYDESIQFRNNRSSDECTISTHLSKGIAAITLEHDEHENNLIKKEPIEIRVRCIFSRVGEIDTLNERFTAELFFEASWYDDAHKIGLKYDPQMGHFNPQLVILNHIGDSLRHEVSKLFIKIDDYLFLFLEMVFNK